MKRSLLILMLTFIAAVGMSGIATAQINITANGSNDPILSPILNQTQDQAQAQAQTSNNTNTNTLTNTNVNIPTSTSSATNTDIISNINRFNPVILTSITNILRSFGFGFI